MSVYEKRQYQDDAVTQITGLLEARKAVMYQLPTAGGKTAVAIKTAIPWVEVDPERHVYWMTHRRELISQSREKLAAAGLEFHGTVLTPIRLRNAIGRGDIVPGRDDLLIADEAHHSSARVWDQIISAWPGVVLGLSATPWRLSKTEGFDHLFDELVCGPDVAWLRDHGFVAPVVVIHPDGSMVVGKGSNGGDYSRSATWGHVENRVMLIEGAVDWWLRCAGGRRTIVYATNTDHAKALLTVARSAGIRAALVLGSTSVPERDQAVEQFRDGELDWFINIEVATEGFDVPDAECVLMLRVTKSLAMFFQMMGRVMRAHPDKQYALVMDATTNTTRFGLPEWERKWDLRPRQQWESKGDPPVETCVNKECLTAIHISARFCPHCEAEQWRPCVTCGSRIYLRRTKTNKVRKTKKRCRQCDIRAQHAVFEPGLGTTSEWTGSPAKMDDGSWTGAWVDSHSVKVGDIVKITPNSGRGTRRKPYRMYVVEVLKKSVIPDGKLRKRLTQVRVDAIRKYAVPPPFNLDDLAE